MEDQQLICPCGNEFTFSAGEQEFYKKKGFTPPKHCEACRARRKAEKEAKGGQ